MKVRTSFSLLAIAMVAGSAFTASAGEYPEAKQVVEPAPVVDPWAATRRPITNPTLFDLAIPQTVIHPLVIYNRMPDFLDTIVGQVPVGGDYQVYALQIEVALSERLSINATKDGYIDFNPDNTLVNTDGWANVGAGLKYAWLLNPAAGLASNFQLLYEIPMGNRDVWQGFGDGTFIPSVNVTKLAGPIQFVDQFGFRLPINDAESSFLYNSVHLSYAVTDWFFPMVEVNWFHVMDPGDGGNRFLPQAGGAVPAITTFEAGDLVNWGALNSDINRDFVSLGVGFRCRIPSYDNVDMGFAWEFPLTREEEGLMKDRFTLDMVIRF